MSSLRRISALLIAMLALLGSPGTALAVDCAADSLGTPPLHAVRDIVFAGVVLEETSVSSNGGPPEILDAYRLRLEHVYSGDVPQQVDLVPLCAPIRLEVGERYVIGTRLYTPPGEWLSLNDRSSIAWHVLPGGAVELQSFGVPAHRYPERYRAPHSVGEVLDLLAPGRPGSLPDTATAAAGETGASDPRPSLALVAGLLISGLIVRRKMTGLSHRSVSST